MHNPLSDYSDRRGEIGPIVFYHETHFPERRRKMKKHVFIIPVMAAVFLGVGIADAETVCKSYADCGPDQFCQKAAGDCNGQGTCQPRPEYCYQIYAPVCGCDGQTYSNDCVAAAAGVSVAYGGECRMGYCASNADCAAEEYCAKATGDCDGRGTCQARPDICPLVWMPVCGCDGQTYGNACEAAAGGVTVSYEGQCRSEQCSGNADCDPSDYCRMETCDAAGGTCETRPHGCPEYYSPVCGCDGRTYGNECEAASAGVNVAHDGECSRSCGSNIDCQANEYCFFESCALDAGICRDRPLGCPDVWDPVCGCDGKTYGNSCEAAAAGVSVDYQGECRSSYCRSNEMCPAEEYCFFEVCSVETGTCVPRPQGCPDVWLPVCGCDGNTYGNACEAAAVGVSVDYEGECKQEYCWSNDNCQASEYCFFADCVAETGVCRARPQVCPDVWDPVCGCDGVTYSNACDAAAAGVSVDYAGECASAHCWSNRDCGSNDYCFFHNCAAETGTCMPRPDACPRIWAPVCGCDGTTYANSCEAARAGVSVDYEGECVAGPCASNNDCLSNEYCAKPRGGCDGTGTCQSRPQGCPEIWDPVCGCDGITYANECFAAMVGVSVEHSGECVTGTCTANNDCTADEYCAKAAGDCDGEGVCSARPQICPMIWDPVCGCDGRAYSNACIAALAGVNVNYEGECVVGACSSNEQCGGDEYCSMPTGNCDGRGTCRTRPAACIQLWDPVCGCDGRTYSNDCFAAMAGINVDHSGECEPVTTPCRANADCERDNYCAKDAGDCGGEGACQPRPQICPDVWDPVCGCDGATYSNACYAARAGVNVDYAGQCEPVVTPCRLNEDCDADSYCAKSPGDCDGEGSCQPRPQICLDLWDPVCGCDGRTYSNACYAAAAGINIAYRGECEPVVIPCNSNNDCSQNTYCSKTSGNCDGQGTCQSRPDACIAVWDPVCGCDGVTYSNACYAAMAGVSVDYQGQCEPVVTVCESGADCDQADDYCAKSPADCDGRGTCQSRPQACPAVWDPVCGCDGVTYSNACYAAMAGAGVDYQGPCLPGGPVIVMREPKVEPDDVHTGPSGIVLVRILWSEPVVFGVGDISIVDESGSVVPFTVAGSNAEIMSIRFTRKLLHDRYTITITESVVGAGTGNAIDGDNNGAGGGDAVIVMEHRHRVDTDNNNLINGFDFAALAEKWLDDLN